MVLRVRLKIGINATLTLLLGNLILAPLSGVWQNPYRNFAGRGRASPFRRGVSRQTDGEVIGLRQKSVVFRSVNYHLFYLLTYVMWGYYDVPKFILA